MPDGRRLTLYRTAIAYVVAIGLVTLALGGGAYLFARRELSQRLDANMLARMDTLQADYGRGGAPAVSAAIRDFAERGARTFGYVLTDARGATPIHMAGIPRLAPGWSTIMFNDHDEGASDPARTLTRRFPDGSTLTIVADRDFIEQFDGMTTSILAASLALLFLLAAGAALSLERTARRRLAALNDTASAIFAGHLAQRVPLTGRGDEFDAMAKTVNAMLDQLGTMLTEVRRVTTYVAHDLRVPLARLRDHLQRPTIHREVDIVAVEQCEDILRLFGAILRIGEIDAALIASNGAAVDLSALVAELSDAHVAVAEDSGRSLRIDVAPAIDVRGDRDLLAQMLINLIDNALSHTPVGAHIAISLTADAGRALLRVADNGPGIAPDRRSRLGAAAGKTIIGAGDRERYGLKLARVIAAGHDGVLELLDNQPGLRVDISLPLMPENGADATWH